MSRQQTSIDLTALTDLTAIWRSRVVPPPVVQWDRVLCHLRTRRSQRSFLRSPSRRRFDFHQAEKMVGRVEVEKDVGAGWLSSQRQTDEPKMMEVKKMVEKMVENDEAEKMLQQEKVEQMVENDEAEKMLQKEKVEQMVENDEAEQMLQKEKVEQMVENDEAEKMLQKEKVEQMVVKMVQKMVETMVEKMVQKMVDKMVQKMVDKMVQKMVEKMVEKMKVDVVDESRWRRRLLREASKPADRWI